MKKLLPVLVILFLLFGTPVLAKSEKSHSQSNETQLEVKVQQGSSDDNEHQGPKKENLKLEIGDSEFEVMGEITSVSNTSFEIGGQTINIDPSKVSKFKQKGILEVGNMAKVEGVIADGEKFAEEIKLIGKGQGRFKFEIKGLFSGSPEPSGSPSASPTSSPDASVEPGASPSVSPSASPAASSDIRVKIKAIGPIDEVITFLEQVLGFLGGLVGTTPEPSPTPSPDASPSALPSASPEASPTPDVSPSPSPEVSPSPSLEASPSPDVSPSPSPAAVTVETNVIEDLILKLQEIIAGLQNLLS